MTVVAQVCGLPVLVISVLLLPGTIHASDLLWGALAGVAGYVGIVLLYRSLSTGAMAVAAPITAVTGALVPMGVGLMIEATPSSIALAGAVCAVVAIAFVSLSPSPAGGRANVGVIGLALASGALFGVFFVLLAQTQDDSGMWPLVGARSASIGLGLVVVAVVRSRAAGSSRQSEPSRRLGPIAGWVVLAGSGDVLANALYLLAAREGLLSVVAPIAALYPVSTVLLALTIDRERVRALQLVGLGLAAAALVLTAI